MAWELRVSPMAGTGQARVGANGHRLPERLPAGEVLTDVTKRQWRLGKAVGLGGFGEIYLGEWRLPPPLSSFCMAAAWRRLLLCGTRVGTALLLLNRRGTSATGAPQHVAELDVSLEQGSRWCKEVSCVVEKLFTRFRAVVRQPCLCHFLTSSVAEGKAVLRGVVCVWMCFSLLCCFVSGTALRNTRTLFVSFVISPSCLKNCFFLSVLLKFFWVLEENHCFGGALDPVQN